MSNSQPIQVLTVDSRTNVAPLGQPKVFSQVLRKGQRYRFEASGQWIPDVTIGNWFVDARFTTRDNFLTVSDVDSVYFDYGLYSDAVGGGNDDFWGNYSSNREYSFLYEGLGQSVDFYVYDTVLSDNSGFYTVKIFEDDFLGTSGSDVINGDQRSGFINDSINGLTGNDTLNGLSGDDLLVGGSGSDRVTGGMGADRFYFRGTTQAAALRESTLRALDQITDFNFAQGDQFGLDFDNNLDTIEQPKSLFNAGREKGNLRQAARSAYADKNNRQPGQQKLQANEAVFFRVGANTYLSINNDQAGFSPSRDLLVNVTGIQFKPGDLRRGALSVADYFV